MFDTLERDAADPFSPSGDDSVVSEIDDLTIGENIIRAELLGRIATLDREEYWRYDGAASMPQWLVARYRHSQATASEMVRVAHALEVLPKIAAAFRKDRFSWDQLRVVTRLATPEDDAQWAIQASDMTVTELNALRRAPTSRQVDEIDRRRSMLWHFDADDASFEMRTRLLDADGATVMTALMRIANRADPDPETATYENIETRLADALVQMASQSLGADSDPDRATVVVHTKLSTLTDPERPGAVAARVAGGPALSARTLHRLTCDARLQMAVIGRLEGAVGVGRTTRTVAPWLRRLVMLRDKNCRFPGCERIHWTDVHHIIHWADDGPTELDNLILLCGFHHRLVHEYEWRISGDPNGDITWIRPGGLPLQFKPFSVSLDFWREVLDRQLPIVPPRLQPEYIDTS